MIGMTDPQGIHPRVLKSPHPYFRMEEPATLLIPLSVTPGMVDNRWDTWQLWAQLWQGQHKRGEKSLHSK